MNLTVKTLSNFKKYETDIFHIDSFNFIDFLCDNYKSAIQVCDASHN